MVLKIKLGKKREKRLKKHLEKEHPSVRGKTSIDNKNNNPKFGTSKQINRILDSSPNFEHQLKEFTEIEGGLKINGNHRRITKKYC